MKGTILYAEDIMANFLLVRHVLEQADIHVEHASNGMDAVRMFLSHPNVYKLILMDLQMPELNGYEATRKIRETAEGKTIRILGFSDQEEKMALQNCLECGMNGFISKTSSPDEWAQTILNLIQ
jgi:CheY-like chemotaxis protein